MRRRGFTFLCEVLGTLSTTFRRVIRCLLPTPRGSVEEGHSLTPKCCVGVVKGVRGEVFASV